MFSTGYFMKLEDIIEQIENISKTEIKRVAHGDCGEIKEIIMILI